MKVSPFPYTWYMVPALSRGDDLPPWVDVLLHFCSVSLLFPALLILLSDYWPGEGLGEGILCRQWKTSPTIYQVSSFSCGNYFIFLWLCFQEYLSENKEHFCRISVLVSSSPDKPVNSLMFYPHGDERVLYSCIYMYKHRLSPSPFSFYFYTDEGTFIYVFVCVCIYVCTTLLLFLYRIWKGGRTLKHITLRFK